MFRRAPIPGILFISDLPKECKKSDVLDIFEYYGAIENVEIVSEDDLLHYARVTFQFVVDAMTAIMDLNEDELILGEPLKVSWSSPFDVVPLYTPSSNAALSHVSLEDLKPPPVHVLFSFISCQVVEQISEQIIAEAFLPFGILTDVNIKKHNTIGDGGYQNGFGFVQYEHSWGGVVSALRAVRWFDKKYMGHMTLDAKFGQQFQHYLLRHGLMTEDELLALKSVSRIRVQDDSSQSPRHQQQHQYQGHSQPRMATMDNLFNFGGASRGHNRPPYDNFKHTVEDNRELGSSGYPSMGTSRGHWPSSGRGEIGPPEGNRRQLSDLFGYKQSAPRGGHNNGAGRGGRYQQRGQQYDQRDNYRYQSGRGYQGGYPHPNSNNHHRGNDVAGLDPYLVYGDDRFRSVPAESEDDRLPGDESRIDPLVGSDHLSVRDMLPGDSLPSGEEQYSTSTTSIPRAGSTFGGYTGGWIDDGEA